MLNRVFKGFAYRDFRIMWIGACTSSVGTLMQTFAQSWLVLQLSGSSFLLGLDSFLGGIPIVLPEHPWLVPGAVRRVAEDFSKRRLSWSRLWALLVLREFLE